jgi:tryptophan synthase alpha chain
MMINFSRNPIVPYIVAGHLDNAQTLQVVDGLYHKLNTRLLELGFPFSEPMADGEVIQKATAKAIANGMNWSKYWQLSNDIKTAYPDLQIMHMGYANPVFNQGYANFAQQAKENGVDYSLIVDMPLDQEREYVEAMQAHNIGIIPLFTSLTDEQRVHEILAITKANFSYYVALHGVTGAKQQNWDLVINNLKRIKAITNIPIITGFGIKTVADINKIRAFTDGIVIGTAIVADMENNGQAVELTRFC